MPSSDASKADSSGSEILSAGDDDAGMIVVPTRPPAVPKRPRRRPAKQPKRAAEKQPGAKSDPNAASAQAANEAASEEENAEQQEDLEPGFFSNLLRDSPSWLTSVILHMVALLALALWTLASPPEQVMPSLVASTSEYEDSFEELPSEVEMEELEIEQVAVDSEMQDPGEAMIGELNVATEDTISVSEIGNLDTSTVGEIGMLFGDSGQGMAEIGAGSGGAKFFGTSTSGRRFVFVVDNSASMTKGRFETALNELVNTVESFGPKQSFYVIFFSDTAYPLFYPRSANGLVPATVKNKEILRQWLYTVELCWQTRGEEALKAAISLRPDAIYVLGDGVFTDKARQLVLSQQLPMPIHTLGMEVDKRGETELKAIAKHTNGTYKAVGVHPAARVMAEKTPRKRNRTRGPVWGIKLPLTVKKK